MLFDDTSIVGRVPMPSADGGSQQRSQLGKTVGINSHQETWVGRQETTIPVSQGTESVHNIGHHNERIYRVLVTVFRTRTCQAISKWFVQHTNFAKQPIPVVGICQFTIESRESRYDRFILHSRNLQLSLTFIYVQQYLMVILMNFYTHTHPTFFVNIDIWTINSIKPTYG